MLIAVLTLQAEYCNAESKPIKNNASDSMLLDDLQRGEWLSKEYIAKLKATKSPQISVEGIVEDSFSIKKTDTGYVMAVIYNFHEGGEDFIIKGLKAVAAKKGVYELVVDMPAGITEKNSQFIFFKKDGADEIQWNYESNHKKNKNTFIRVEPSVSLFVNRILLAGEYKDERGNSFIFTESGVAKWPDKQFRYETLLDYIGSPASCDLLMEIDQQGRYSNPAVLYRFAWQQGNLLIYRVDNTGENPVCAKQPTYKLRRSK